VSRLVDLAREASPDALTAREQAGLHDLEQALSRKRTTALSRLTWLRWVFVPAGLAGAAAAGVCLLRERAITFEVVSGRVSDGGYISSSASGDAAVRFSDHSDIDLEPGTQLRITHLEVRGARVMLEAGTLHAHIHTRPRGHWTLDAGPYIVHVTGTAFDLSWRVEDQTLDLRLQEGAVTIEGPLADAGLRVVAGQHLVANANAGTLSLDESGSPDTATATNAAPPNRPAPTGPAAAATDSPLPEPDATPLASASHVPSIGEHRAASRSRGTEPNWRAQVAHGDFEGVLEDAERRGIDRSLSEGSAGDLAALADAARYARRPDIAMRALSAERRRFAGSVQARDASFFLGGLAEAQKSDAASLEWYDAYLRESPNGAYASQALGHKMMIVQRVRGSAEARPFAIEYLARFADGPYAPQARKLSEMR
jgi:hypothetical protein